MNVNARRHLGERKAVMRYVCSPRKFLTQEYEMTGKRGFGSMDPERQRQIASQGGKAAHRSGKAYKWNRETARAAGRLGGLKVHENRRLKKEAGKLAEANGDGQAGSASLAEVTLPQEEASA